MSMNGPSQNIPSIHSSNVSNGMQQHPSMQQSSQLHESPPNIMTSPPGSAQAFYLPAQIQQPQVTRNSPINLSNLNPEAIAYNPVSHPAGSGVQWSPSRNAERRRDPDIRMQAWWDRWFRWDSSPMGWLSLATEEGELMRGPLLTTIQSK